MDNITWKTIIKGWKHLMTTSQDGTLILKSEVEWSNAKDKKAHRNSKALNVIFNGVGKNMFKLINMCTEEEEA